MGLPKSDKILFPCGWYQMQGFFTFFIILTLARINTSYCQYFISAKITINCFQMKFLNFNLFQIQNISKIGSGAVSKTIDVCIWYILRYTVRELKDLTNRSVWSNTTLITSSVGGAGVDPTSCKMGTFFLSSLGLSVPMYRNFQSNGCNWTNLKL